MGGGVGMGVVMVVVPRYGNGGAGGGGTGVDEERRVQACNRAPHPWGWAEGRWKGGEGLNEARWVRVRDGVA